MGEPIVGETAQKAFIALFGAILRLRNILQAFDEFPAQDPLTQRDVQDYQSMYLDLYQDYRVLADADKESINDDVLFEIELIKQVEINVDYILMLVKKYHESPGGDADKEIKATIDRAVDSSVTLRSKRDLIQGFVESLTADASVDADWRVFIEATEQAELDRIIADEGLDPVATRVFVGNAFRDGQLSDMGTAISEILPPVSRFSVTGERAAKKAAVLEKLSAYFERFYGLG